MRVREKREVGSGGRWNKSRILGTTKPCSVVMIEREWRGGDSTYTHMCTCIPYSHISPL